MSESKFKDAYKEGYDAGKKHAFDGFVQNNFDELSLKDQIEVLVKMGAEIPRVHSLKILPEYFKEVMSLAKTFEIRKNDRNFQVGDYVELREWKDGEYTGHSCIFRIGYIFHGGEYGLEEGYCILSLNTFPYYEFTR